MKVLTEIKICNRLYHISYISIYILNLKIELPSLIIKIQNIYLMIIIHFSYAIIIITNIFVYKLVGTHIILFHKLTRI